jgi:hypothetical protein
MISAGCIALVMYMEARSESFLTQSQVAYVAMNRAAKEKLDICTSIKRPKSYSWMWDGENTIVDKKWLRDKMSKRLERNLIGNRLYFNECSMGKLWKTQYPVVKFDNLCFY